MSDVDRREPTNAFELAKDRLAKKRELLGISDHTSEPSPQEAEKKAAEAKPGHTVDWPLRDIDGVPVWRDTDWAKEMGAPERYHGLTHDTWELELSGGMGIDTDWAEQLDPWCYVICGPTGTGKTHYATILFNIALETLASKGWPRFGLWLSWPATIAAIKEEIGSPFQNRTQSKLTEHRVLMLDDVGASRSTDFVDEILQSTILTRYDEKLPTIITTNASDLSEFEQWPRIASRLAEGVVAIFEGTDQRLEQV